MRLGILIASLKSGGAERAALGLLEMLDAAGAEAYLLTLDRNRRMLATLDPRLHKRLAPRIVGLASTDIDWSTPRKLLNGPWHWLQLTRAVRRLKLDVVLSVMERANILSLLTPGRQRRIVSIRSYPSSLFASKSRLKRVLVERLYGRLLRHADDVVVVSREAAADIGRLFPAVAGRCKVIYNACNLERLRARCDDDLPGEHAAVFDRPVVLASGRLNKEKGHWSLLRAFARVSRSVGDVRLVLLGDGPLREALTRLARELGIGDRVLMPGFQDNPLPWIARSRVFVLPSQWEGFPNSLLEALAAGVPIVASDCRSGPRELLAPESDPEIKTCTIDETPLGLLVPSPDGRMRAADEALTREEQILADAIERSLGGGRPRREDALAVERSLERFAPERIAGQWTRLLARGT